LKSIIVVFVDTKKSNKYNNNQFYFMKQELLGAAYLIVITLTAGFVLACVVGTAIDYTTPRQSVVQIVEAPTVQPTTTVTPYIKEYPSFITYTVRSVDPANLKVVTTNGDILYFKSRGAWSQQVKRCTYTASVESSNGYSYVIRGYPVVEEVYLPPDNDRGRGEYVEV
jgi:hypothetical protein